MPYYAEDIINSLTWHPMPDWVRRRFNLPINSPLGTAPVMSPQSGSGRKATTVSDSESPAFTSCESPENTTVGDSEQRLDTILAVEPSTDAASIAERTPSKENNEVASLRRLAGRDNGRGPSLSLLSSGPGSDGNATKHVVRFRGSGWKPLLNGKDEEEGFEVAFEDEECGAEEGDAERFLECNVFLSGTPLATLFLDHKMGKVITKQHDS